MEKKMGDGTALEHIEKDSPLITVGNRTISKQGWTIRAAEAHLLGHLLDEHGKWCEDACMAKVMFGRNSDSNRYEVRRRMSRLRNMLLERGKFLVVEYDRGKIERFKMFEAGGDQEERALAKERVNQLLERNEVSAEQAQRIQKILDGEKDDGGGASGAPALAVQAAVTWAAVAVIAFLASRPFLPQWWLRVLVAAPVVDIYHTLGHRPPSI